MIPARFGGAWSAWAERDGGRAVEDATLATKEAAETLSIRLPSSEAERVRDGAYVERLTLNEFCRRALSKACGRRGGYPPRPAGVELPRGRRMKGRAPLSAAR